MTYTEVLTERRDAVEIIALNRPKTECLGPHFKQGVAEYN